MHVSVLAANDRRQTLTHLMQLYLYDLSQIEGLEVEADGLFPNAGLEAYWSGAEHHPFLICQDQRIAGFALVNRTSRIRPNFTGHAIAGLFVLRRYRRMGIGRESAAQLFDRFPGMWEIATFGSNVPALSFWRSVADTYTGGRYNEVWHQDKRWRGSIQSFTAPHDPGVEPASVKEK